MNISDFAPEYQAQINRKLQTTTSPAPHNGAVRITLKGQVRGGKNNMGVTAKGIHYPRPDFKAWRDEAIRQVKSQYSGEMLTMPLVATIAYYAGDNRRRDIPAILDAIWHVLERSGVVVDDALIKDVHFSTDYDKANPRAVILLDAKHDTH